ncbi:MAG TPA: hypothetical protein VNV43_04175 [Candidatus Acidoferrales bacterium]|jgi:hypothetical protein|nr:hypothetical protein [Candidatus Acidoferrales bacterium]
MKIRSIRTALPVAAAVFAITCASFQAAAQTVQYVTLTSTNEVGKYLAVQANQLVSTAVGSGVGLSGYMTNGAVITLGTGVATGMTNIEYFGTGWTTVQITTPAAANIISNYVRADAIVIPASATGNAQIILESSPDLVNWTAAEPGIYGPSASTNRFFRVRAVVN